MARRVVFLHTSPAAIPPLMQFYSEQAPDLEITNLLDDGLLRLLRAGDTKTGEARFSEMLRTGVDVYGAEAALVTCSAVPQSSIDTIRAASPVPLVKIDWPMAKLAAGHGGRIGVAVTFEPTMEPTSRLLREAAAEAGRPIELIAEVVPQAYKALLAGDAATHDRLLLDGVDRLAARDVAAIVLAQVSMARVLGEAKRRARRPVYSSLETSLSALREAMRA